MAEDRDQLYHYFKVGDLVDYFPAIIDTDAVVFNAKIVLLEPGGSFFNQTMFIVEGVEHWIPQADCRFPSR